MPFDAQFWTQFEGQTLDAGFRLDRYTGAAGSYGDGATFETQHDGHPARIEITPASVAAPIPAAELSHPALAAILASGETNLASQNFGYVVVERADEYLSDVLAGRSLDAAETAELLPPLLDALRFLQAHGFRHGDLTPAKIMACGDQLKISGVGIARGDDPAADSAAIGALLQRAFGIGEPARMPAPFGEIAARCLDPDPGARLSLAEIEAHLSTGPAPTETARPTPSNRTSWLLAAAAVLAVFAFIASRNFASDPVPAAPPPPPKPAIDFVEDRPSAIPLPTTATPAKPAKAASKQRAATVATSVDGVRRVLPDIPQQALNTITGRVRISARVRVDNAGNVKQASLETNTASKYFSERVLTAARAWKFPAASAPRDVVLTFELTRGEVTAQASESRPAP